MDLKDFDKLMRELLVIDELPIQDPSLNGLQVERSNGEIRKVALAVDASLETFRAAVTAGADLLFVHHGLLWSKQQQLRGNFYKRIKYLMDHDLALYAVHLPLDLHPRLGNNIGLAEALGLEEIQPFGKYHGLKIGMRGVLPEAKTIEQILTLICRDKSKVLGILPFGPQKSRKIGIVSGGDPLSAYQAIEEELDLFITGEPCHQIYHSCLEGGLNVIFAGHYATETWGIQRVAQYLPTITDLEVKILDVPTGL